MQQLLNSEQLKIHTQQVHMDLERTLIPKIRSITSRSEYATLLKVFYTFYAPIENQLKTISGFENFTAGIALRKTDSLRKDIHALEEATDDLSCCSELPTITNKSHALGVMYVLEGSVLGGKVIAGLITKQLASDHSLPFSFFLHYGNEALVKWQQFKTHLDSAEDVQQFDFLSAAEQTFLSFKKWIDIEYVVVEKPSTSR